MPRSKHGSYLFQRDGSDKWWIKVRSAGKRIEKSLGTSDRREAEIFALPLIAEHKQNLFAARPRIAPTWQHEYAPGREHVGPDGGRVFATERELFYLDPQGVTTRKALNGGPAFELSSVPRLGLNVPVPIEVTDAVRPKVAVKNGDDALLETYLKHANLGHYSEREARDTWSLYKTLTDSKPIKDATRDDGRKLVAYFENQGLKSATVRKKITWLAAPRARVTRKRAANAALPISIAAASNPSDPVPRRRRPITTHRDLEAELYLGAGHQLHSTRTGIAKKKSARSAIDGTGGSIALVAARLARA